MNWWRAETLTERVQAVRSDGGRSPTASSGAGRRRYERWRAQFPFADPALFKDRLAADQIDEDEFLRVLCGNANEGPVTAAWAQSVEDVYASWERLRTGMFDVPNPDHPMLPFMRSVEPLIKYFMLRLRDGAEDAARMSVPPAFDPDIVPSMFIGGLLGELQRMLVPTMILELNVLRMRDQLNGDTSPERFQYFISRLGDPAFAAQVLREYPVLARMLVRRSEVWVESSLSFLRHLSRDWHDLTSAFSPGSDLGPLAELHTQLGDSHRGGRSVMVARFGSGRHLVYKPRSLRLDVHFQELLGWVNRRIDGPRFRTLTVVDRGDHGWVEFVDHASCRSSDGVRRFYERQGCYLGLMYLLDGTDCHCENVVASGEHPVIVDLEALFHPRFECGVHGIDDPAVEDLHNSVVRVGLLPGSMRHAGAEEKLDRSGLGSVQQPMMPFGVLLPEGDGTDEMHLVRKRVPIRPTSHLPVLDGRDVDQIDADAVIRGFEKTYRCLWMHRDELLGHDGPLARFRHDETRVVLRNTNTYSRLLTESFHPDMLCDALDRDQLFDMLWAEVPRSPHLGRVIPSERADLWNGDVPVFTTRVDSRDIFSSAGHRISEFFAEPGEASVRRRVESLSEADLEKQLWFIHSSLATLEPRRIRVARRRPVAPGPDQSHRARLIHHARAIGDRLVELAAVSAGRAGWNGMALAGKDDWVVTRLGADMYDGTAGIVLFLAYLAAVTNEERYHDLALAGATMLHDGVLRAPDPRREVGPFNGRSGLVYLSTHLAALWGDARYGELAHNLAQELPQYIDEDENHDVVSGAAGCIGSLLALHQAAPSDTVLSAAIRCGDHLLRTARPVAGGLGWPSGLSDVPLAGFSHGVAGVAWALVALTRATGEARFKETAIAALDYERGLFDDRRRNWADLRVSDGAHRDPELMIAAWCHGAAGVGLSRIAMMPDLDGDIVRSEIVHAVETTLAIGFGDNHSLCHGDFGNLDFVLQAAEALGNDAWRVRAWDQAGRSLSDIESNGWRCGAGTFAEVPGLMTGLSGIGYGMIRLAEPQRVPSVLLLSPTVAGAPEATRKHAMSGGRPT